MSCNEESEASLTRLNAVASIIATSLGASKADENGDMTKKPRIYADTAQSIVQLSRWLFFFCGKLSQRTDHQGPGACNIEADALAPCGLAKRAKTSVLFTSSSKIIEQNT